MTFWDTFLIVLGVLVFINVVPGLLVWVLIGWASIKGDRRD